MNIKEKVLLIEDERTIRRFMQAILTANGYDVLMAGTGAMADTMISSHCPDIIILDLGLPDMDGMTILRNVRKWSKVPILVVSARSHERDKVEALDAGADDYLTKPFGVMELISCVKAVLRRCGAEDEKSTLNACGISMNTLEHTVSANGERVTLTYKEYELLKFLMINVDLVFDRETLYEKIWGMEALGDNATVAVHINRLREKLEKNPSKPRYIQTVWGAGYRFKA